MLKRSAMLAGKKLADSFGGRLSREDYADFLCREFGICVDKEEGAGPPPLSNPGENGEGSGEGGDSLVWELFLIDLTNDPEDLGGDVDVGSSYDRGRWMVFRDGYWQSSDDNIWELDSIEGDDPPPPDYDPVATNLFAEGQVPSNYTRTGQTAPYEPPS